MDKKKLTIGVFITLALLTTGYFVGDNDQAYYCESRDLAGICDKLSSGLGTRCYFNDTYKTCKEGWTKIDNFVENYTIPNIKSKQWSCNQIECTPLK